MLSSHLLSQVQSVCDRIGIFAAGRLVGQGTVEQLAAKFGDGAATIEVGLELATAADVERAEAALQALGSVESVQRPTETSGPWRVRVSPASAERSVRQAILASAVEQGLHLTALRPIVPSLDDIYRAALARPVLKRVRIKPKSIRRSDAGGSES
jgi:ABC-2 type transport system ATP-binding protein